MISMKITKSEEKLNFDEFLDCWRLFPLFGAKSGFWEPGPPKKLPEPYVYKGFCAGGAGVPFWTQRSAFGPQNREFHRNTDFCMKMRGYQVIWWGYQVYSSIFPKEYLMFWQAQKHGFHRNSITFMISHEFHDKLQKYFLEFLYFPCFRTRAAGMPRCL